MTRTHPVAFWLILALAITIAAGCADSKAAAGDAESSDEVADLIYACHAPANPDRGFDTDVDVRILSSADGPTMAMEIDGQAVDLGSVETATLTKADPATRDALTATVGLFAEADVSGLEDPEAVDSVILHAVKLDDVDESEIQVLRFMAGDEQVGGTLSADGLGTRCLPPDPTAFAIEFLPDTEIPAEIREFMNRRAAESCLTDGVAYRSKREDRSETFNEEELTQVTWVVEFEELELPEGVFFFDEPFANVHQFFDGRDLQLVISCPEL